MKLNINNDLSWHEIKINYEKIDIKILLFYWLLNSAKSIFFGMPFEKINFVCSKDIFEIHGGIINRFGAIVENTNDLIKQYGHLKGIADNSKKVLFFNVGHNLRYKSMYKMLHRSETVDVLYMNMDPGFNQLTRTWEDRDVPLSLPELVNLIEKENIRKIISINHYLLDKYLEKTGVNLISLFWYLGVEYVIIDNDPPDLSPYGYLHKAFYNCNSFDRFSVLSLLNKYWDNKYRLENIHYVGLPQDYENNGDMRELKDNYAILVLTNSRLENVKPRIKSIIYLLDHMNEGSVFTESLLWYMSLRHMILKIMKLDEFEMLHYNSRLHMLSYTIAQFLKYEVIENIDTERRIEVYGDVGWETVFPEYYKKLLDNEEINELFSQNNHLYLLLNCSYSYLDASGPVYDAIRKNVPFINMPPLVKTSSFEGFRHIEYTNREELNDLIENIREIFDNKELNNSIRLYRNVLESSTNEIERKVLGNGYAQFGQAQFHKLSMDHKVMLDQMIEEYIDRNEPFLRETFRVLFLGESVQYDISKSRYFNRKYVQRILGF
ncbi:MAG: hypothetical protein KAV40_02540 [Thermoplasmatales archaeon]|jgi:hypothetical protein|nr:hypothetical protein [Thermoplasmatales archaeon]